MKKAFKRIYSKMNRYEEGEKEKARTLESNRKTEAQLE